MSISALFWSNSRQPLSDYYVGAYARTRASVPVTRLADWNKPVAK